MPSKQNGPKPMTGYTTSGNVNTDQQFSGPMPWESSPTMAPPRPFGPMPELINANPQAPILTNSAPQVSSVTPMPAPDPATGGHTPMPAGFNPASAPQTPNISQPPRPMGCGMPPAPMMGGRGAGKGRTSTMRPYSGSPFSGGFNSSTGFM